MNWSIIPEEQLHKQVVHMHCWITSTKSLKSPKSPQHNQMWGKCILFIECVWLYCMAFVLVNLLHDAVIWHFNTLQTPRFPTTPRIPWAIDSRPRSASLVFKAGIDATPFSQKFMSSDVRWPNSPHMCTICGKRFKRKQGLERHRTVHSGEKPHQCSICGKRFTQVGYMHKHIRNHNEHEETMLVPVQGESSLSAQQQLTMN